MTRLLILSSHSVLEHDDLRLFTRLGYDVFMPGGYADPRQGNDMRPGVPEAPYHPELAALVQEQRERHAGESDAWPIIDWGKADLHPKLIEWADVIMVNCFPESWIGMQWARIREKRVIWRTIGQSDPAKERLMQAFTAQGLQVVRYSPAEKRGFGDTFAGEDAMIRFAKDAADYGPWIGDRAVVGHLAQHDKVPHQRDPFINWAFAQEATDGLPFEFCGTHSELIGGLGSLSYDGLRDWLRHIRCSVYTGTQPASYTLGLMEAMMAGVPVISIQPDEMWLPDLFEGHKITPTGWAVPGLTGAALAKTQLQTLLDYPYLAADESRKSRERAIELFGVENVGRQWVDFLGVPFGVSQIVTGPTEPSNIKSGRAFVSPMMVPLNGAGEAA